MKKFYRPTVAEIDLSAIRHNLKLIRDIVGKDIKMLGVVKADAYGHGIREVSTAIYNWVDYYGIASLDEAAILRETGIKKPILVLGSILPEEAEGVLKFDVVQTVSEFNIPKRLSELSKKAHRDVKVHIKVDTGMGRLGVWYEEAFNLVKEIIRLKGIVIEGIFTHFSKSEDDPIFTHTQLKRFISVIEKLQKAGIDIPIKHAANSMALIEFKDTHLNMVRPGLMMYGLYLKEAVTEKIPLRPALSLKTRITHLKEVSKGRTISYGGTFVTKHATRIAVIPVGYGDGYSRRLSNKGEVLVRGIRAPIIGRVCMDMCIVDVGHIKGVGIGDEVVLIGRQGNDRIKVEDIARLSDTIPYEVVCNIGRRVPRVYINSKLENRALQNSLST